MTSVVQSIVVPTAPARPGGDATSKSNDAGGGLEQDKDFSSYLSDERYSPAEGEVQDTDAVDKTASEGTGETDDVIEDVEGEPVSSSDEVEDAQDIEALVIRTEDDKLAPDAEKRAPESPLTRQIASDQQTPGGYFTGQTLAVQETEATGIQSEKGVTLDPSVAVTPTSTTARSTLSQGIASSAAAEALPKQPSTALTGSAFELTSVPVSKTDVEGRLQRESLTPSEAPQPAVLTSEAAVRRDAAPVFPGATSQHLGRPNLENRAELELSPARTEADLIRTDATTAVQRSVSAAPNVTLIADAAKQAALTPRAFENPELRGGVTGYSTDLAEFDVSSRFELQAASKPGATGLLNTPDLPKHIAQQISASISTTGGKTTEVALNPAELGRVRISLSSAESGLVVSILAERPETLDLMRRNAMQLAAEFTDIGYGNVEFNFGQSASGQAGSNDQNTRDETGPLIGNTITDEPNTQDKAYSTPVVQVDRVDIRI